MNVLTNRHLLLRSLVFLVATFSCGAVSASAEDKKPVAPEISVPGEMNDDVARQESIREDFLRKVEESPYELAIVNYAFVDNGYLEYLQPRFSERLKSPQTQNRVLVFVPGDKGMAKYRKKGPTAFMKEILHNHEAIPEGGIRVLYNGEMVPVLICIKTISTGVSP